MNKAEIKAKWLQELRSGEHKQVPGTLKGNLPDGSCGFCCLGVLQEKVLGDELTPIDYNVDDLDENGNPNSFMDEGPRSIYNNIKENIIGNNSLVNQLTDRNDNGWTFPEIADYIEREWKVESDQ